MSLGDYVISCTNLSIRKALEGKYEESLKQLYNDRVRCSGYSENLKHESMWISKTLAVLIQCAMCRYVSLENSDNSAIFACRVGL